MKTWILLGLFGMVLSGNANAAVEVRYEWPAINGLRINAVCATADTLRSLEPVLTCVKRGVVARQACSNLTGVESCRPLIDGEIPRAGEVMREDVRCVRREPRYLEVSREVEEVRCLNACAQTERRRYKTGRAFNVSKYEMHESGDVYIGDEHFIIPECRSGDVR